MEQENDRRPQAPPAGALSTVPSRPLTLSAANACGRGLGRLGLAGPTFDPDRLARQARRRTGLDDFGDASLWEALDQLSQSVNQGETGLTPTGRLMARYEIMQRLTNRLRIEHAIKTRPQILAEPLAEPIFILGLPRTGTTLLQRLLAQDPGNRVLETWEMAQPVPAPTPETYAKDWRVAKTRVQLGIANHAMPRLKHIHEVGARLPEECLSLMANDLISYWFVAVGQMPRYRAWLHEQDLTLAYRLHRRQLQLLQAAFGRRRWVLKSPFHLFGLPWLLRVYPDARIIQTHRDPLEVLPSFASLLLCLRSGFCDGIDPTAIGEELTEDLPRWFANAAAARADAERPETSRAGARQFLDVDYRALAADPLGTVQGIYRAFAIELSESALQRMDAFIRSNPRHKHGVHRYSLDAFGIERERVQGLLLAAAARQRGIGTAVAK